MTDIVTILKQILTLL